MEEEGLVGIDWQFMKYMMTSLSSVEMFWLPHPPPKKGKRKNTWRKNEQLCQTESKSNRHNFWMAISREQTLANKNRGRNFAS